MSHPTSLTRAAAQLHEAAADARSVAARRQATPAGASGGGQWPQQHNTPRAALEDLAALLDPAHHITVLITGQDQPPRLAVAHRRLLLAEDIYADHHCFWWGWADRIARVTDPAAAAQIVTRWLTARPEPAHG